MSIAMQDTWMLVTDDRRAQLYKVRDVQTIPTLELVMYRTSENGGGAPVHDVVTYLSDVADSDAIEKLVVVAPKDLLKQTRYLLSDLVADTGVREVVGNYAEKPPRVLQQLLHGEGWLRRRATRLN